MNTYKVISRHESGWTEETTIESSSPTKARELYYEQGGELLIESVRKVSS